MKESAIMPATVGADFSFLNGSFHPYAGANVGTYLTNTAGRTTANFGLHPKIGVFYELGDHFSIDLAFKYHFTFFKNANTQMVGANLGVGYRF